jgi:EmrB/QacA subfamily drug resistance transporter
LVKYSFYSFGRHSLLAFQKSKNSLKELLPLKGLDVGAVIDESPVKKILPGLVAIAFFMESLDATILNTAVPMISQALHITPLSMKSVLSSYTLSLAVFIPISSWMADKFGTRLVFSSAIGIFTLGSLLCGLSNNIHLLVLFRILQGFGGAMMVPVGRLTIVRTFAKSELVQAMSFVAIPALIGPMIGPLAGGLIVGLFHWRVIFFLNIPIGLVGLYFVYKHLPDYRGTVVFNLDVVGLILFGSGVALLSYILEVFGEHTLSGREVLGLLFLSATLLTGYGFHAKIVAHPLLRIGLLKIRTLRSAVSGSFLTRLGAGGMPFLLPLLYQVGLGYTPIQSGLLIMPQPLAAIGLKVLMPHILTRFGYKAVLLANTILIGLVIAAFSLVGSSIPVFVIVILACFFGFSSSLQYTSMNTLSYADVEEKDMSMASNIVSTMQQMSMSFGVAMASLSTAFFISDRFHTSSLEMVSGLHKAFLLLGALTIFSAIIFWELKQSDGESLSQHEVATKAAPAHGV